MAAYLGKTIEEVESLSEREFTRWQIYYSIEPFGEYRADIRSAMIACVIANVNRGKNTPAFKVDDFMPKFGPSRQMSNDEIRNVLKGLTHGNRG